METSKGTLTSDLWPSQKTDFMRKVLHLCRQLPQVPPCYVILTFLFFLLDFFVWGNDLVWFGLGWVFLLEIEFPIVQASLKLSMYQKMTLNLISCFLPPPEFGDYGWCCLAVYGMLGFVPRTSCTLKKHTTIRTLYQALHLDFHKPPQSVLLMSAHLHPAVWPCGFQSCLELTRPCWIGVGAVI